MAPDRTDSSGDAHSKRVLIVDDHPDSAESLALLLDLAGYETRTALTATEAIAVATAFRPEVVLLDIGLPEMSGYEVARRLRGMDATRGAVLIALTGYARDEDRRTAEAAGFDHHLAKPVEPDRLRRLLGEAFVKVGGGRQPGTAEPGGA